MNADDVKGLQFSVCVDLVGIVSYRMIVGGESNIATTIDGLLAGKAVRNV